MSAKPTSKKFGKSSRDVPAHADKAKKWYNADDEKESKQVSLGGGSGHDDLLPMRSALRCT